jgi:hypothetical protein
VPRRHGDRFEWYNWTVGNEKEERLMTCHVSKNVREMHTK